MLNNCGELIFCLQYVGVGLSDRFTIEGKSNYQHQQVAIDQHELSNATTEICFAHDGWVDG